MDRVNPRFARESCGEGKMANPLRAFWRDAKFGVRLLRVLRLFGDLKPDDARTIADDFEDVIDAQPDKVAFVFEGEMVTYR
jgi:hypothetical protein